MFFSAIVFRHDIALAQCLPDNPPIGGNVVCSGQDNNGFSSASSDLTIEVQLGAEVNNTNGRAINLTGGNSTVVNNGSISTTGSPGQAILAFGENNVLTNNGTIATTGVQAIGMGTQDNGRIFNNGSISTSGALGDGIDVPDHTVVVNNGTITVTGQDANGIEFANHNTIINKGTISVDPIAPVGASSAMAALRSNNIIINGGLISAPVQGTHAIRFDANGGSNHLTLLPGSRIIGSLLNPVTTNTLNVVNGLSVSKTFTGFAPIIGDVGGAPFAVSGTHVAVVDPTTLSTPDESLADLTGGIFGTVQNRLSSLRNGTVSGATNSQPLHVAEDAYRQYWVQGFGSYRNQQADGPSTDTDQQVAGIVSGVDAPISATSRAGFFLGGSWGEVETTSGTQQTGIDSFYGGAYLSTVRGRTAWDFVLTGGRSDHDREREVANNLAAGGLETAQADYDGWFISPEVTVTRPFWPLGLRLEKIVTLRYAGLFLDGFEETGASDNLTIQDRDVHIGVARAALAVPFTRQGEDGGLSRLTLTGGIEGRTQFGDEDVSGTLLAQSIVFDAGGNDTLAGVAAITGEHTTPRGLTAFVSLEGKAESEDSFQLSGRGGVKVRF